MVAKILIASDLQARQKEINQLLSLHLSGVNLNHPDLLYFPADSKLGINEAKKIKAHFSFKPLLAKGKVAILEDASSLTTEAQNALLKILEELPENGLVILGADSQEYFLPTILSRCQIIKIIKKDKVSSYSTPEVEYEEIEKLLKTNIEERFKYIEKLEEKEEFLDELINYFRTQLIDQPKPEIVQFLDTLLEAKKWSKQNVNTRAILEYLILKVPSLKQNKQ